MLVNLLDSICMELASLFPNVPIHIQDMPTKFSRPAIYVELVANNIEELNRELYRLTCSFQIVVFADIDEYSNADKLRQLTDVARVLERFNVGSLRVVRTSRSAKITELRADARDNELYINLGLSMDGVRKLPTDNYDLMGEIRRRLD